MDKKGRKILHKTLAGFLVSVMVGTTAVPAAAAEETAGTGAVVYESEPENELDGGAEEVIEGLEETEEDSLPQEEQAETEEDSLLQEEQAETEESSLPQEEQTETEEETILQPEQMPAGENGDGKNSLKSTVRAVRPDQVTNVSVKTWGATAVKISWTPAYRADGYYVYRATSKKGTYQQIARITGNSNSSYINRGLTTGRTYYYKVRAFAGEINGDYSTIQAGKAVPKQVQVSKIQSWGYNGLKISWGKIAGAAGYRIYRATSPNGNYSYVTQIGSGNTCSYVNTKLTTGQKYYYKVRAFAKYDGEYHFGAMSPVNGGVAPRLKQAVITKAVPGYEKVTLSWNKVNGAAGYQIYYREADDDDDDWEYVKALKGTSYTHRDDDLDDDVYYYKVRAIRYDNGKKQFGTFSAPIRVRVPDYDDDHWDDDDRWDDDDDRWDDDWDD